jgi:hypothetical protein
MNSSYESHKSFFFLSKKNGNSRTKLRSLISACRAIVIKFVIFPDPGGKFTVFPGFDFMDGTKEIFPLLTDGRTGIPVSSSPWYPAAR